MSGLAFDYLDSRKESDVGMYEVKERLALTEDERLVPEEDPEARWLYAIPGQEIPLAEAERYGLVKKRAKAKDKQAKKAEDK